MPYSVPSQRGTGEIDFGPAARIELHRIQLCFFDHHLKGPDNGLDREPPVRVFVMGDNQWRDEAGNGRANPLHAGLPFKRRQGQ